jgi:two-component system cell cycle sensor histidine kinase/response regulator CckA
MAWSMDSHNEKKTILVVDGDPEVLRFVSGVLVDSNYNVLRASSGSLGLQQSRNFKSEIHLLLSDFALSGMCGMDLATQVTLDRPKIQVLLMSGFPGGMLVLNEGWHFLAKPFIPSQLRTIISGLISPNKPSRFGPK